MSFFRSIDTLYKYPLARGVDDLKKKKKKRKRDLEDSDAELGKAPNAYRV